MDKVWIVEVLVDCEPGYILGVFECESSAVEESIKHNVKYDSLAEAVVKMHPVVFGEGKS